MSTRAIILLSGGLDSAVSATLASRRLELVLALTFHYGQRAASDEIEAAQKVAHRLGVEHQVIPLPWMEGLPAGALVDRSQEIPQPSIADLDRRETSQESARAVWVPNRNGVFLNIAACVAEARGADTLITGFNAEEAATFPDNSPAFLAAANEFFSYSTANQLIVVSFVQEMTKRQMVEKGKHLGVVFEELWSCYNSGRLMCGRCESCQRSKRAYQEVGLWETMKPHFAE